MLSLCEKIYSQIISVPLLVLKIITNPRAIFFVPKKLAIPALLANLRLLSQGN
jgi:hypothetical protein